jgi:hypothetical protein
MRLIEPVLRVMCAGACSSLLASCTSTSPLDVDLFERPEARIGEIVEVFGLLEFEFENRNLFPAQKSDRKSGRCLPVAIARSDSENIRLANSANGTRVRITGQIQRLLGPNDDGTETISLSFCKPVGIWVTKIERG